MTKFRKDEISESDTSGKTESVSQIGEVVVKVSITIFDKKIKTTKKMKKRRAVYELRIKRY